MPESKESKVPQKPFNPQKPKKVLNHAYASNFPWIDANIFEDDFFNMKDIPDIFNTQAKILEYELLEIFWLKILYGHNDEASQTWRQTPFLELCRNWNLEKLVIHTNWWIAPIFADGIFERLRKLADNIDDFNSTNPPTKAMKIIAQKD